MTDYKSMYTLLCKKVDEALSELESIPEAHSCYEKLLAALLEAEEIYIDTSPSSYEE